ncbi:MAG: PEP-CTERM sorting domain-containing protein [Planctomycetales bacterium]|nr:PEP-CTERM sorting domain-containing protein [Planctomycetales bacterium]
MKRLRFVLVAQLSACLIGTFVSSSHAAVTIEPDFHSFPAGTEGIPLGMLVSSPGRDFSYVSGDPRNELLDTLPVVNTTMYTLTGFGLEIIGTGTDTDDPSTIVRGAPIDAVFGDVNGDGVFNLELFPNVNLSADGRRIEFSGGAIAPGERFSAIHLAISDMAPELAGIDSWFTGTISDQALCSTQGDPVAAAPFNLVDAYCIAPFGSVASDGTTSAKVEAYGQFPANANGQVDVFVIWEPTEIDVAAGEDFTYSTEISWSSDKPDAVVKEWVGNFNGEIPVAYNITDTSVGLPTEMTKTSTSATVTNRTFDDAAFPGAVGRYHFQVTGLTPGELVTFQKMAVGGHVVPEPTSASLLIFGIGALAMRSRKH